MNYSESGSVIQRSITDTFRNLWCRQILWIRAYIISTACEFGNTSFIAQNIMNTDESFSDALWKFYGYENAEKAESLLKDYFNNFEKFLNDMKNGEPLYPSRLEWYKSADEIIEFLTKINRYWSKDEWQRLIYTYMQLLEDEASYRLLTNYADDSDRFRNIENITRDMADYMASGIIKQFDI
ncbi:MAG: hypothetical protein ACYCWE_20860 [Eubacteriales bacterium]